MPNLAQSAPPRPLRVLFDDRPAQVCGTGIGRYAAGSRAAVGDGFEALAQVWYGRDLLRFASPEVAELELPALLEREEIDVYHCPLFQLPAVLPARTRAIVTVHDAIPAVRPDLTQPGFLDLWREQAQEAVSRAARVVCPSEHARHDLLQVLQVPQDKLVVVPEAPAACFVPAPGQATAVCARLDLTPGEFVLAVGSLERRKAPDLLLDALVLLEERLPGLTVAFAGPAAGFDLTAEAAARGLGARVRHLGQVSDEELAGLYAAALCLAFPSRYEGFGLPVLEAFAMGAPVVASASASIPEVAGDAALLVTPEDPVALACALERVANEPELRAELTRSGRARVERTFTTTHVRAALEALYTELQVTS